MKKGITLVATALLVVSGLALLPAAESAGTTRLVAFGDTSAGDAAKRNVAGSIAEGAQGYIGLGDYDYDYTAQQWKDVFAPLTSKGSWMALGNHDDRAEYPEYFPDGSRWSKSVAGARIVALNGMSAIDTTRLRSDLCNAPESVRIVITHHNWWLGSAAHHPGSEFPTSASTMDAILKDCGVDLVLAGHEHNYQRMTRNGIPYVIVGTGGRGVYPVAGSPSGTVATCACLGRLVLDLGSSGFSATFKQLDGATKDTFSMGSLSTSQTTTNTGTTTGTTTGTSAAPTFTPKGGSEWWVQVAVSGSPTAVAARDTGGAWVPLAKKSWGDWAASFHVESGHDVQYRATLADGSVHESCWFDHPAATCASGATTTTTSGTGTGTTPSTGTATGTFSATFSNVRGNEWWVEANVAATGGTLAGVKAKVNDGAWVALEKKSWGSWAKSLHAPAGSQVSFQAVATDGQTSTSSAYAWIP